MRNIEGDETYDVFLSHSTTDSVEVEALAHKLRAAGVRPFLDKWHLVPGEPWQEALERALQSSLSCAVFLGRTGLGPWENEEMRIALDRRVGSPTFRVIPVLLPGAIPFEPSGFPRFLERLTWVDFRAGLSDEDAFARLLAGVRGEMLGGGPSGASSPQFSAGAEVNLIHPLSPAPAFVGRIAELQQLLSFWHAPDEYVGALVGLGGAGKTALAAEFLSRILDEMQKAGKAARVLVWSFYVDQDVERLLEEMYQYFGGRGNQQKKGHALVYGVCELLARQAHALLILDGLELVQRDRSELDYGFGDLREPLLRQLLTRIVAGLNGTKCLITTRLPLSELAPWDGRGYVPVQIDSLTTLDALAVLRRRGVRGSDAELEALVADFGAHALTLDHLAIFIGEFCGGLLAGARQLPEPNIGSALREERKLARILRAYEQALSNTELQVLSAYSVFRLGVSPHVVLGSIVQMHSDLGRQSGVAPTRNQMLQAVPRLYRLHLLCLAGQGTYTAHPAVRDHFYKALTNAASLHRRASSAIRREAALEALEQWEQLRLAYQSEIDALLGDLQPTLERQRQLAIDVLTDFRTHFDSELSDWHKFELDQQLANLSIKHPPGVVVHVHVSPRNLSIGEQSRHDSLWRGAVRSYGGNELITAWRRLQERLLGAECPQSMDECARRCRDRVMDFLAEYEAYVPDETRIAIDECIAKMRVGICADLPQMRLAHARLQGGGRSFPSDKETLDLLEELIYHTVRSGELRAAEDIYKHQLGGRDHLARTLGDYARGVRIRRSMSAGDRDLDLAWYLRGVGELAEAYKILRAVAPLWAGTILCLQGFLPAARTGHWRATQQVARFLSGDTHGRPDVRGLGPGEAFSEAEAYLFRSDPKTAMAIAERTRSEDGIRQVSGEVVRCELILAEAARQLGQIAKAQEYLDQASLWTERSGSVEHLCLQYRFEGRLWAMSGRTDEAKARLLQGIAIARQSGMALHHIESLIDLAELLLAKDASSSEIAEARSCALAALNGVLHEKDSAAEVNDLPLSQLRIVGARHPTCHYIWGEARAHTALARVHIHEGKLEAARLELESAIVAQQLIDHPLLADTRLALDSLTSTSV
jgi:tetratricopeptide (TPR) repeat protein